MAGAFASPVSGACPRISFHLSMLMPIVERAGVTLDLPSDGTRCPVKPSCDLPIRQSEHDQVINDVALFSFKMLIWHRQLQFDGVWSANQHLTELPGDVTGMKRCA